MPKALTPEQQRHYRTAGHTFPIRVLSAAEADLYRGECDRLETLLGGRPRTVEVRQMHLHLPWAYRLAAHPRVLDAVQDLLGPNLLIWATELFAKHPHDSVVSIAWHRDGAYMGLDAERTVTAWIALTESGPTNGGMRVAQEPNRLEYLQSAGDRKAPSGKQLVSPAEDKIVEVALQAGEMSLHDVHVLHGSGVNQSGDKRVGFAVRFTTPETKPAIDRPPALLVRGEDRWGHFELFDPPSEDDPERALGGLRASARQHLEATLQNLKQAAR